MVLLRVLGGVGWADLLCGGLGVAVWAWRFGVYVVMGLLLLARVGLVYILVVCWLLGVSCGLEFLVGLY